MPPPSPAQGAVSVRFQTTGARDAMLAVTGAVDEALAERCIALLDAARGTGAAHVLVDLSDAGDDVPPRLAASLSRLARDLDADGGWLLVHGGGELGDPEPDLAALFDAYRRVAGDRRPLDVIGVGVPAPRSAGDRQLI